MLKRRDGRTESEMRNVKIIKDWLKDPCGSCLIEMGNTKVLCVATLEEKVPMFLKNKRSGWITAEYGMLPGSTPERVKRERVSGRIYEIQRFIGRSFRSIADLEVINGYTITIDCDVIQADGGTRVASITGGYIALYDAIQYMLAQGIIDRTPIRKFVAACSVGIVANEPLLDLTYEEDVRADVDMNVVMTDDFNIIEIQATGETRPFNMDELNRLLALAKDGITQIFKMQRQALLLKI
jgi:ribonuclease PH